MLRLPDDPRHRSPALCAERRGFPDDLLDRPEGEGYGEGEAQEGAEWIVHCRDPLLHAGAEVVPAPGEEEDASPLDPDPLELTPDHGGEVGKVEVPGFLVDRRIEEVYQAPLGADCGITVHHPDEDPSPADPDRLGYGPAGIVHEFEGRDQGDDVAFVCGIREVLGPALGEGGAVLQ